MRYYDVRECRASNPQIFEAADQLGGLLLCEAAQRVIGYSVFERMAQAGDYQRATSRAVSQNVRVHQALWVKRDIFEPVPGWDSSFQVAYEGRAFDRALKRALQSPLISPHWRAAAQWWVDTIKEVPGITLTDAFNLTPGFFEELFPHADPPNGTDASVGQFFDDTAAVRGRLLERYIPRIVGKVADGEVQVAYNVQVIIPCDPDLNEGQHQKNHELDVCLAMKPKTLERVVGELQAMDNGVRPVQ